MRRKKRSTNTKELFVEAFESALDYIHEFDARLKDLDQKVEHLIRKQANNHNHHGHASSANEVPHGLNSSAIAVFGSSFCFPVASGARAALLHTSHMSREVPETGILGTLIIADKR